MWSDSVWAEEAEEGDSSLPWVDTRVCVSKTVCTTVYYNFSSIVKNVGKSQS